MERTRGKADGAAVRAFCEEHGLTLNAFFTAAFAFALKAYADAEVPVFTTIYNGRNDPRLENSVSMLVKTLPVTLSWQDDDYVVSLIEQCKAYLLSAMANDIYSFAEASRDFGIKGDILFAYQGEFEHGDACWAGKARPSCDALLSQAKAGMDLDVLDGDEVVFDARVRPVAILGLHRASACATSWTTWWPSSSPKTACATCTLVTRGGRGAPSARCTTPTGPWPSVPPTASCRTRPRRNPDASALVACDRTLTYGELNAEANAVGHVLAEAGAGPETMVAVLADRDSWAYVMRQAALKSGGAFLPIDPEYPEERVRYILEDSGCSCCSPPHRCSSAARSCSGSSPTWGSRSSRRPRPSAATIRPTSTSRSRQTTWPTSSTPPAPPAVPRASCSRTATS